MGGSLQTGSVRTEKGEKMYKEAVVSLVPKEGLAFLKNGDGFAEHLVKQLSLGLSDKLMTILDKESEVIVRQSEVKVSEYKPTNSVEYRRQIEWSPLVRCKDCKHCSCDSIFNEYWCNGRKVVSDGFCNYGEKKDENN